MIHIDTMTGCAGGLALRGGLVLAALTGQAVRLSGIRSKRPQPGLKLQHLRLIEVLARACDAVLEGALPGSQHLLFEPRRAPHWERTIDGDTPGSLPQLLQTLLLPMSFSGQVCRLRLAGVTHAPRSPAFEYLTWHWLPLLERAGYRAEFSLQAAGFAPKGGGIVLATIHPVSTIEPLCLAERGALLRVVGRCVVAGLSPAVAERQRRQLGSRLQGLAVPVDLATNTVPAAVPGAYTVVLAQFERGQHCSVALGELGRPPEAVANEAADALLAGMAEGGAVDRHGAGQLLLPLAFACGRSQLSTACIDEHLIAMAGLIDRFLPGAIRVEGRPGEPGMLYIDGRGAPAWAAEPELAAFWAASRPVPAAGGRRLGA
jgi:RNA 3'-terminal phosphate cyclase (ATP)